MKIKITYIETDEYVDCTAKCGEEFASTQIDRAWNKRSRIELIEYVLDNLDVAMLQQCG